jgi:voltage-gated potassium channel
MRGWTYSESVPKTWVGRRPRSRHSELISNPWGRFRVGVTLLAGIIVAGTLGYVILGLGPLDAAYQTVVTISTVGYREIGEVDGRYQIFTMLLILFGTGTSLYTLGVLLETLFEGRLDDQFRRRRMQRDIDRLSGHVIVCGFGQVGRAIVDEVRRAGRDVVVVDRNEARIEHDDLNHVCGEATDDEVIALAGLTRAGTLVLALDSDADNLFVVLSARSQRPDLFIVARANLSTASPKLFQAGADRVVNPHEIGGSRMAAMILQPEVAEFLDVVMHDRELEVRLAEVPVEGSSHLVDTSVGDARIHEITGSTLLAVRRDGRFLTHPSRTLTLHSDDVLIALGTPDQLSDLQHHVSGE